MASEFKVKIDNTYMNVIKFGEGKKNLVVVSGISLAGLEGQGEGIEKAYSIFEKDYTIYLFERKKVLNPGENVEDMADDLYRVLCEIGVRKACFYGVSQGGMIVQILAIKYPELVEKLVLCSTYSKVTDIMKNTISVWRKCAEGYDVVALNRDFFKRIYSKDYLKGFESILPELEKVGTPDDCDRFLILSDACLTFDCSDELNKIKCPVFVLGSKCDAALGYEETLAIAEKLGCDYYLYENYGHAVYDEAPDIQEKIFNWLK